jgi:hypothetical protein
MDIPWWIWPIVVYLMISVYFTVAILRTEPGPGPGDRPLGAMLKGFVYTVAFLILVVIWPQIVCWDTRNRVS